MSTGLLLDSAAILREPEKRKMKMQQIVYEWLDKLITKERQKIVEGVRKETAGLEERIVNDAVSNLETYGERLKQAFEVTEIHPLGMLEVIEKGGIVYRGVVDTNDFNRSDMPAYSFIEELSNRSASKYFGNRVKGKQRVTIIIEPLEK